MTTNVKPFKLQRPGTALGLLGCLFLFCLVVAGVLLPFVPRIVSRPEAAIRISAVIQDVLLFIIPAVGMAMIVTRLPAKLLAVDSRPSIAGILWSMIIMICSIPVMNCIIEWNNGWHLPSSMSNVESFFRQLEEGATATTDILIHGATIPSLIVSILIVGVLAGFSEELFFRGAFQRVLMSTRINPHIAIWFVAFIFSAFHFQFFGFIPRMLLGAFFGYLLWWSGSVWLPIILHIFNNSIVVIAEYLSDKTPNPNQAIDLDKFGANLSSPTEIIFVVLSVVLVIFGICHLYSVLTKNPVRIQSNRNK